MFFSKVALIALALLFKDRISFSQENINNLHYLESADSCVLQFIDVKWTLEANKHLVMLPSIL